MSIRFNPNEDSAKKYLPPQKEKPSVEELKKDSIKSFQNYQAGQNAKINSIIDFARNCFKSEE